MKKAFIESRLLLDSGALNAVSLRLDSKPNYFSMRRNGTPGGVEAENRGEFFGALGFQENLVARAEQVHGNAVAIVESPGIFQKTDALITQKEKLLLTISVADCVPILIFDRRLKIAAAVHAGWRGTAKGIVAKVVDCFYNEFDSRPDDVVAFVGPSAGVCCYEVGDEVAGNFSEDFIKETASPGKFLLDLKSANVVQLISKGIPTGNIELSEYCSICDENFHSFRRDGKSSGRMLAAIAIR